MYYHVISSYICYVVFYVNSARYINVYCVYIYNMCVYQNLCIHIPILSTFHPRPDLLESSQCQAKHSHLDWGIERIRPKAWHQSGYFGLCFAMVLRWNLRPLELVRDGYCILFQDRAWACWWMALIFPKWRNFRAYKKVQYTGTKMDTWLRFLFFITFNILSITFVHLWTYAFPGGKCTHE